MSKTDTAMLSVAQTQYLRSLHIGQSNAQTVFREVVACQISDYANIASWPISHKGGGFSSTWPCWRRQKPVLHSEYVESEV